MPENPRLEELRRRVQADPASIAFAALAEEYRRIGHYEEAIETCRVGLQRHPAYLSARVTLGRALIEVGEYEGAREELETVLRSAPENLAAIRGLAQIHERLGHVAEMDPSLVELANQPLPVRAAPPRPPEPPPPPAVIEEPPPAVVPEHAAAAIEPARDFSFDAGAIEEDVAALNEPLEEALDLEPAGPDPATLATLARLEQFLGAIQHARSVSPNL